MLLARWLMVLLRWLDDLNRNYAAVRYAAWYSWIWMPGLVMLFSHLLFHRPPGQESSIVAVLFGASFVVGFVLYFTSWIRMSVRLHQEDPKLAKDWERDHATWS